MFFYLYDSSGPFTTIGGWVQLELGPTPTAYEPYVGGVPSPNPDYPQDVNVVTGTQTITLSDGTVNQDYTVGLGSIELCKIGNYQDYIFKQENDYYIHKEIGKVVFTGSADETWSSGNSGVYFYHTVSGTYLPDNRNTIADILASSYTPNTYNIVASTTVDYGIGLDSNNAGRFAIRNKDYANTTAFKTWLASNNTIVYYPLDAPTYTKITDATLVSQLNAIHNWLRRYDYYGVVSGNLPIIIDRTGII